LRELKRKSTFEKEVATLGRLLVEVGLSRPRNDVALGADFERLS
jgi:hypothetical protein